MYFETLALEIHSTKSGWEVIKPPRTTGVSGVEHRFTFLASKDGKMSGFDIFPEVREVEVLKAFIKEMDSGVTVYLVCLRGRPTDGGMKLAEEYGMKILGPGDIGAFFDKKTMLVAPKGMKA